MHTPSHSLLRRTIRRAVLAASLLLLACGSDTDEYAPLGTDPVVRATVVAGIVRDANRGTVADAVVVMEPANDGVPASAAFLSENLAKNVDAPAATTPGRRVTTTNLRGNFAFENVESGEYYLQVIADDHLGAMHSLRVPDHTVFVDTVYVDVNLTPTGTFSGAATLENAAAHQGTVVYVQGTSYVAVTDPAGNYALTDVPVGSYTVRAEHAHYLEDTESGTITTAGENVALASMLLKINSNISPVATIVSASPPFQNIPTDFVASGSDADGTIALYEWDWEDDGTFDYSSAVTANASHTYAGLGAHRAKLRVTDDDGAIGLAAIELTIIEARVYMATTGNDLNSGSSVAPVATLLKAYEIAQANSLTEIYVAQGTYSQVPDFQPGISVYGGRVPATWEESPAAHSQFNIVFNRATANGIVTATTIRRVVLLMAAAGGQNAIALYSTGSDSNLRFEECRFTVANGPAGASGAPGALGTPGGAGLGGAPGSCDGPNGMGGAGGGPGCFGGAGGAGGAEGPNNGAPGQAGNCGGGAGGTGGAGDNDPSPITCNATGQPGSNGVNGAAGAAGAGGIAASALGTVVGGEWVPNTSGPGAVGQGGRGGGGGGGGGGQGGGACNDGGGNGGGGGGGGGLGGGGGQGGVGGRASFCVMLVNSSPRFELCVFERGNGGQGGAGGAGGIPGGGGGGAPGASSCTSEVGRGGNGGNGGAGGQGGGGAGGPGGPSYGVYKTGTSNPTLVAPNFVGGAGGTGGPGGSGNGQSGPPGLSGNTN